MPSLVNVAKQINTHVLQSFFDLRRKPGSWNISKMASEGTPHPLTPSTLLSILLPSIIPTTAPVCSSMMGPPLEPAVGGGLNNICESASYVPGLASRPAKSRYPSTVPFTHLLHIPPIQGVQPDSSGLVGETKCARITVSGCAGYGETGRVFAP